MAVQQNGRDLTPFVITGSIRRGLVGTLVPVSGILMISLFAMQVGMDPRRFLPLFLVLRNFVCAIEISLGIPPKGLQ